MLINSQRYDYNTKLTSPIISQIKSKSSSNFDNNDKKNHNYNLYNKEDKKLSTKDKLDELNQVVYSPSSINTMILKSKFETMA